MIRKIINIDEKKCNGCGLCAKACHEGAIGIVDGKAKLMRDDYCDGLGDCLPACPMNAISFIEREALPYDEEAVKNHKKNNISCKYPEEQLKKSEHKSNNISETIKTNSQLRQWPVQIKLMPINATYFNNSNFLVAADCTAYAYANFHNDFIKDKITIIGCPKLDSIDYTKKLEDIISNNNIKSITVIKMEVPCCRGIENAVKNALIMSKKFISLNVITISTDGKILN